MVKIDETKSKRRRRRRREGYHIVSSSVQNRGRGLQCSHVLETDQNGWSWKWKQLWPEIEFSAYQADSHVEKKVEALLYLAFVVSFSPFETHATNYHTHKKSSLESPLQQLKKPVSLLQTPPPYLSLPLFCLSLFTLVSSNLKCYTTHKNYILYTNMSGSKSWFFWPVVEFYYIYIWA